jgi:reactive intermediate/imine deaminase
MIVTLALALLAADPIQDQQSGAPFATARRAGDTLYLSGMIGSVPAGMDAHGEGFDAAARAAMDRLGAALKANGAGWNKVVKCTAMLADMTDWARFNTVYLSYFKDVKLLPARSAFGASGLARGAAVEVECIAWLGQ